MQGKGVRAGIYTTVAINGLKHKQYCICEIALEFFKRKVKLVKQLNTDAENESMFL